MQVGAVENVHGPRPMMIITNPILGKHMLTIGEACPNF